MGDAPNIRERPRRAFRPRRQLAFVALWLLLALASLPGIAQAAFFAAGAGDGAAPVLDFGLTGKASGWALTPCALWWTGDDGATWRSLQPPAIELAAPLAVAFADAQHGIVVQMAAGRSGAVTVARTTDAGVTWEQQVVQLLAHNDAAARVASLSLQMLDAEQGWLLLRRVSSSNFSHGALFFTGDGGVTWQRRNIPAGEPFFFRNAKQGWTVGADGVTLLRTDDGAHSWATVTLTAASGEVRRRVGLPVFAPDGRHALLPVIAVTAAGQEQRWQTSTDGGISWQPWSLQTGAAAQVWLWQQAAAGKAAPLDLAWPQTNGVRRTVFTSAADGWALGAGGRLLRTGDGAHSWQTLAVPGCITPVATLTGATIPPPEPVPDLVSIGEGAAFDICELPTPAELAVWRDASPYRIVNLYIGGSMRACANRGLNNELIEGLGDAGWRFIPTWVGPQAPCTDYRVKFSMDLSAALAQGRQEAVQALAVAQTLGLTTPDGGASVIYYDLEAFDDSDAACTAAAQAFVQGWSAEMRAGGSLAGLYAAACWPGIGIYAQEPAPDAVWMAHWVRPGYDPTVTVWDVPCVANSLWVNQQRIRQYSGGHDETWGGVTFNIDANVAAGPVADPVRGKPATTAVVVEEPTLTPADDGNLCSTAWYRYVNRRGYPAFLTLNRHAGDPAPPIVNSAAWQPQLPVTGVYRVEVYLPAHPAVTWECPTAVLTEDSGSAIYTIHHAAGTTARVIDQMTARDGWIDLGVYSFTADGSARLTLSDETDEAQFTVTLSVSAARFTLLPEEHTPQQVWLPLIADQAGN